MEDSTAKTLGVMYALLGKELSDNPDDISNFEKIKLISDAYRNFTSQNFSGFREEFEGSA